jgi:hypothetical protein
LPFYSETVWHCDRMDHLVKVYTLRVYLTYFALTTPFSRSYIDTNYYRACKNPRLINQLTFSLPLRHRN